MTPTLDQRRASHAWQAVQQVMEQAVQQRKDYKREAKKLPVRIRTAGLGQALAFVRSKKKADNLLAQLDDWVLRHRGLHSQETTVLTAIVEGDSSYLRICTEEVLAYLQWLNRFAEPAIEDPEPGED